VSSEAFKAMRIPVIVFWVVTPCRMEATRPSEMSESFCNYAWQFYAEHISEEVLKISQRG
jgi:hypothetical protein